jgi:hypothetical protein
LREGGKQSLRFASQDCAYGNEVFVMMSRKQAGWPVLVLGAIAIFGGGAAWMLSQDAAPQDAASSETQVVANGAPGSAAPNASGDLSRLRMDGIGPVTIGMTREEAERAMGQKMDLPFPTRGGDAQTCTYGTFAAIPGRVAFMLINDVVARIDVMEGTVATPEGAWISNNEFSVAGLYAGRSSLSPHKYVEGHYLTVTSNDPAQAELRYVFETENGMVTRYRAGRMPEVEYVEGCS